MTYTPPLPPARRPVHDEGSLRAFEYYRDMLRLQQVRPINHTEREDGDPTHPEHLLWMCEHCAERVRDDSLGMNVSKYSRWLGYIQGCMISRGFTTVAQERDRTRNWFQGQV